MNNYLNDPFDEKNFENTVKLLEEPLAPERVVMDPTGKIFGTYLEAYDVIDTANRIFGYGGWSTHGHVEWLPDIGAFKAVVSVQVGDVIKTDTTTIPAPRYGKGHEQAGQINLNTLETASKDCFTTAMKRAFRMFGSQFGNELYDKTSDYHEIAKENMSGKSSGTTTTKSVPVSNESVPCEECGKAIKGSTKYTLDQIIGFSKTKNDGKVLCYNCAKK
jgi:DNA repair and recombination protein RAD52